MCPSIVVQAHILTRVEYYTAVKNEGAINLENKIWGRKKALQKNIGSMNSLI